MSQNNANDIFPKERFGLITGSACSVLFPTKSAEVGQRSYAKQLANQMYFQFYDDNGTWQTDHGHFAESSAFEFYQTHFDKNAIYQPKFKRIGYYGGSADCLTESEGVDLKCPTTLEKWVDYLHTGISKEQYHQAQMYMYLYDRPKWSIIAFLLETNRMSDFGLTYPVPYEKRAIKCEVLREDGWVEKLHIAGERVIQWRDEYYAELVKSNIMNANL